MTTAATSLLGLALPVTGELSGTWGDTVNNSITSLLDTAVAGTTTLSTDGDVTLSTTTLAANQARQAILLCSGARTAIRTITAPAQSKIYTIINATTGGYAVKLVGVGPTTGLTIPNGASAVVAWNGSDFIEIGSSTIGNLTVNGNLTVTGSTTLSGGTANGVAYLNGSKVVTTGTALTFDGTTFKNNAGGGVGAYGLTGSDSISNQLYLQNTGGTKAANLQLGSTGTLQTWVYGGSSWVNATTIDSSGNLGIGTTSPTGRATVTTNGSGGVNVNESTNATSTYGYLTLSHYTNGAFISTVAGSNAGADILRFGTGNTERMRLDSSGNLGLGVTPSAWSTLRGFQVGQAASLAGHTTLPITYVGANWYFDGTNNKYITSNYASRFIADGYNGGFNWQIAPSGTAGAAISFTQAMTLDASGNLGIGTTSPGYKLDINTTSNAFFTGIQVRNLSNGSSATSSIALGQDTNLTSAAIFVNSSTNTANFAGASSFNIYQGLSAPIAFYTNATERARIDSSGNFTVGATSGSWGSASGNQVSPNFQQINKYNGANGDQFIAFSRNSSTIGSITQNGTTGVLYNLTSDYRLKNNPEALTGAKDFIMALQPKKWQWWDGSGEGVGFIAHEFMEVAKYSGHGEKDAVETIEIKDEEGNVTGTEERPIYQSIQPSSSEVMANLVAHIQELEKRLAALEAK